MTLKELLDIAKKALSELNTLDNPDFRLEQAEYLEEKKSWDIVVSYLVENTNPKNSPFDMITSEYKFHRMYQRLIINEHKNITGLYIYNKK